MFYSTEDLVSVLISSWETFTFRAAKHPELFPRFKRRLFAFAQYWMASWPIDFEGEIRTKLCSFIGTNVGEPEASTLKWLFVKVRPHPPSLTQPLILPQTDSLISTLQRKVLLMAKRATSDQAGPSSTDKETRPVTIERVISFSNLMSRARKQTNAPSQSNAGGASGSGGAGGSGSGGASEAACTTLQLLDNMSLLAEQMTLIEAELYSRIEYTELLKQRWSRKDAAKAAPRIVQVTEHFNKVAQWVCTEILAAYNDSTKAHLRVFKQFVALAKKLYLLHNFNGAMQVLSGLGNVAVQRLKPIKDVVEGDGIPSLKRLESIFSSSDNYKNYRELAKPQPFIPFLAIVLRDLTFIDDGNVDWKDEAKTGTSTQVPNDASVMPAANQTKSTIILQCSTFRRWRWSAPASMASASTIRHH